MRVLRPYLLCFRVIKNPKACHRARQRRTYILVGGSDCSREVWRIFVYGIHFLKNIYVSPNGPYIMGSRKPSGMPEGQKGAPNSEDRVTRNRVPYCPIHDTAQRLIAFPAIGCAVLFCFADVSVAAARVQGRQPPAYTAASLVCNCTGLVLGFNCQHQKKSPSPKHKSKVGTSMAVGQSKAQGNIGYYCRRRPVGQ